MPAFKLDRFIGEIPRLSRQQLPDNAATVARNCRLLSGNIRALHAPAATRSFSGASFTPLFAYHLRESSIKDDPTDPTAGPFVYPETWIPFRHQETSIVKGPVTKDRFERYYWTLGNHGPPRYFPRKELARMGEENSPPFEDLTGYLLGVPAPTTKPTVTPTTGSQNDETRSYVYTFVSQYGEEGPPSPATTVIGDPANDWFITNMDTTVPNEAERVITKKYIYRTVPTAADTTEFVFVDEVALNDPDYVEQGGNFVEGNETLQSTTWIEPPADLDGLVEHPNGFLVGFSGFDIFCSEVFSPHAWPDDYVLSIDTPIVALAVLDNAVVVLTEGSPHVISGVAPDSLAVTKIETAEPCFNRFGVVVLPDGVYYPSGNGLAKIVAESVQVVTTQLVDSSAWRRDFSPQTTIACRDHEYYLGFTSTDEGYFLAPTDPSNTIIKLDSFDGVKNIFTDRLDGEVYYLKEEILFRWDPPGTSPITFTWRSKDFVFPKPINLGAFVVDFDAETKEINNDVELLQQYNNARLASGRPLNPLAYAPIAGSRYEPGITPDIPQFRLPLGGSSLFDLVTVTQESGNVRFIVYADGAQVYNELIVTEVTRRLPATHKTDKWQVELIGNTDVFYCKLATTGRELMTI